MIVNWNNNPCKSIKSAPPVFWLFIHLKGLNYYGSFVRAWNNDGKGYRRTCLTMLSIHAQFTDSQTTFAIFYAGGR